MLAHFILSRTVMQFYQCFGKAVKRMVEKGKLEAKA
jgi:hypothetical protein